MKSPLLALLGSWLFLLTLPSAHAFEPTTERVTDKVYAIVGEIGQRSAENQGLNNTTGFIITADGVLPNISKVKDWQATLWKAAALQPEHVIPGHGKPGDWASAQKNTGDYLNWLVTEVGKALEEMEDLGDAVERLKADGQFNFLQMHDELHGRNIHQTYLQLEAE